MNIFALDINYQRAAQSLCDKHVPKMALETAQILCTVAHKVGIPALYKPTHLNHPCVRWAAETKSNWAWLVGHACSLWEEHRLRFQNEHASSLVLFDRVMDGRIVQHGVLQVITRLRSGPLTPFALAIPEDLKPETHTLASAVEAYRAYYLRDKSRFASWSHARPAPEWWTDVSRRAQN